MRHGSAQQYKWKWTCQREKYFEMRSNGSRETRELFLPGTTWPGTIENCNSNSSEGVLESVDHLTFLAFEFKTLLSCSSVTHNGHFFSVKNLLAATKLAFKYFWRRRIVRSLCAAGSKVIYQLSLVSLRWRSQPGLGWILPEIGRVRRDFVTISTNFQVLKSHPERLVRAENCQTKLSTEEGHISQ